MTATRQAMSVMVTLVGLVLLQQTVFAILEGLAAAH